MERIADRFFLHRGQSLQLPAGQASAIIIVSGRLSMMGAPQWLGEGIVTSVIALEGQAHPVEPGGWIRLTALTPAEIIAVPRTRRMPTWHGLQERLRPVVDVWRRRLPGRGA
ncbi:hypothetical protein [Noviherbaspirillum aerium]|uniref:hypothetical protein n=1 Tax=Noviherbaspirillum aerium TaxID=2588497 RepID=UPI00124D8B29|nr:hypothetical protein [Noviherbaspirillum aerium]